MADADAEAARQLAAASDRDSADLRGEIRDFRKATTASLSALRADQIALRVEFGELRDELRTGFATVRGQLDRTEAGLEQISGMLGTLLEERPRDGD